MTTILFIDAFKPDYVKHAPFIQSLTEKYQHGHVTTPLGFWGAMETFYRGSSNTLALYYLNEQSSLRWTKSLNFLGNFPLSVILNLTRLTKGYRPFFRIPGNMPLDKLHLFDIEVKEPLTTGLPVKIIDNHTLDRVGHQYGPDSAEIRQAVKELDLKISSINFDMIISDHGMGTVTKRISVPQTDCCFLDSTMARYWDKKPDIPQEDGQWITGDERFGKHIFLANPGVLVAPNYWSQGNELGMHGWDPNHPDMHAFYLIKRTGSRQDKTMQELYNEFIKDL